MGNPFIVSSDIGSTVFTVAGQPIFHTSTGAPTNQVSASFATTAFSASYALSASVAARTSSVQ